MKFVWGVFVEIYRENKNLLKSGKKSLYMNVKVFHCGWQNKIAIKKLSTNEILSGS